MSDLWATLLTTAVLLGWSTARRLCTSDFRGFDSLKESLGIFPGTKWCGAGDRATSYEDLGTFNETDVCCREHDHCPDYVGAGESSHGLHNTGTYTRSHCDCDSRFYRCLRDAGTAVSDNVGATYFNVLGPQCFRLDLPSVGCADSTGFPLYRCTRYNTSTCSGEMKWQWFDNLIYKSDTPR